MPEDGCALNSSRTLRSNLKPNGSPCSGRARVAITTNLAGVYGWVYFKTKTRPGRLARKRSRGLFTGDPFNPLYHSEDSHGRASQKTFTPPPPGRSEYSSSVRIGGARSGDQQSVFGARGPEGSGYGWITTRLLCQKNLKEDQFCYSARPDAARNNGTY